MPIKRVQFPDGSIKRVEVPEGATNEQIIEFVASQHQAQERPITDLAPVQAEIDPTEGMDGWDTTIAGLGQSANRGYRGIVQAGTEHFASQADWLRRGLDAVGLDGAARAVDRTVGDPMRKRVADIRQQEAERRKIDAPLLNTTGGMIGAVVGDVAQVVAPGGIAKLAARAPALAQSASTLNALGRTFLPTTVRGNAALGGAVGAMQPVAGDGERLKNAAVGTGAGAAGAAIPRAIGATVRGVRGAVAPFTTRGGQRKAVETVMQEASDPARLMRPNPSEIPGVRRSLFDETQDAGVARLETRSRGNAGGWVELDKANNAARVAAIQGFAGAPEDIRAAVNQRSRAATPLREQAMLDTGVDLGAIKGTLRSLMENPQTKTNTSRLRALLDVEKSLDAADDSVASLYGVRKEIDALMGGKAGGDKTYARAAKSDLVTLKSMIDGEIAKVSPSFGAYLGEFIDYSKPIDRMKVGQRLLQQGSGRNMDADTGVYTLMPGQFGGAVKNLDGLTERATKFRGNTAASVLRPEDMATVNAVADDLARQSNRLTYGSGGGSHTTPQAELGKRIATRGLARVVPFAGEAVEFLEKAGARHLERHLAEVLQNPEQYRAIAAQLSRQDQRLLEQAFIRAGGVSGTALAQ